MQQINFGLSPEAGVTGANLSFYQGVLSSVDKYIDIALLGAPGDKHIGRDCVYLPCLFTTWIKNCPEFKYLMFFLISHSWNVWVWCGLLPTCFIPSSSRVMCKEVSPLGWPQPENPPVSPSSLGQLPRVFCFVLFSFPDCSKTLNFGDKIHFIHIAQHVV